MAYRLKNIAYHETQCYIVLQNENGPCPLIAAANALILRGVISLDSAAIRANVISTDELVSMLANWALSRTNSAADSSSSATLLPLTEGTISEGAIGDGNVLRFRQMQRHQNINGVMEMLPNLQFGLDVNPKFTDGPDSCEYTTALAVFDALGVDLVHGWMADPQDENTFNVLRGKSYNQLMDMVLKGGEASDEANRISETLQTKTAELYSRCQKNGENKDIATVDMKTMENLNVDWVEVSSKDLEVTPAVDALDEHKKFQDTKAIIDVLQHEGQESKDNGRQDSEISNSALNEHTKVQDTTAIADVLQDEGQESKDDGKQDSEISNSAKIVEFDDPLLHPADDPSSKLIEEISCLQSQLKRCQELETKCHLISTFLNDTSHQLTFYGLGKLHDYISDGQLCVFFRNNHFSTITKHSSHLFLLVTDLGYANVDEVVWEKLDNINGDTDYADCKFKKPKPRALLTPTAPILSPETALARKGQHDMDYQLALRISEGKALDDAALDEEEAALVAAVKEASLHSYNSIAGSSSSDLKPGAACGSALRRNNDHHDADYELALKLQQDIMSDMASEALARQLEAEERISASRHRNPRPNTTNSQSESKSRCIVS